MGMTAFPETSTPRDVFHHKVYELHDGHCLTVEVREKENRKEVSWTTNSPAPFRLHWGISRRFRNEWSVPPETIRPPGTHLFQDSAAQTPFAPLGHGTQGLRLEVADREALLGIPFVLLKGDDPGEWIKDRGKNFYVPLLSGTAGSEQLGAPGLEHVAEEIVSAETGKNSWTLMHRFNLCHDLLDDAAASAEGMALLFVWLRFSAIRQLSWQRNYNTKPRELSHAMDRLTGKLAGLYASGRVDRPLLRLIFTTLGRGGEGQRIRDEILEIMHRHHIKEVAGTFMEEWHQKMHNNTTPDDIAICEAYLDFLRSEGNADLFYQRLREKGVTRRRLESYERPIKTPPDFIPHLKDALIHDFEHFLNTLKAVHTGLDLETSIHAASGSLHEGLMSLMHEVRLHWNDASRPVEQRAEQITQVRYGIKELMDHGHNIRDLLFLDLSLEVTFRALLEGHMHLEMGEDTLVRLVRTALENLLLSEKEEVFEIVLGHWNHLEENQREEPDHALRIAAVMDRLGNVLSDYADRLTLRLQPKAEFLGEAFGAEPWTIRMFSEEVIRGRLAFVLSMLVQKIDRTLCQAASQSIWRVISPGRAHGELRFVEDLEAVQSLSFSRPTVILAAHVNGNEEIPRGVTGILSGRSVDVLSHLAIRTRNSRTAFAACHVPDEIAALRQREGQSLDIKVDPGGDVSVKESKGVGEARVPEREIAFSGDIRPTFTSFSIPSSAFRQGVVGRKSLNSVFLEGRLPDWVRLPRSIAVPFGVFEKTLGDPPNVRAAARYEELTSRLKEASPSQLDSIRSLVTELRAPEGFMETFGRTLDEEGLPALENEQRGWDCIKGVWASKWTERAFLSRRVHGIPHHQVYMSVLVQEVAQADYAFVIHTVNPLSGDGNEIYAEVVPGLGETLTGNYPGAALGFTCNKENREPRILSYPGKNVALHGKGLIFRSDSSAEDLPGYAGAGLHDSVLLEPPRPLLLDYTSMPLVRDRAFLKGVLSCITRIGLAVEEAMGSPQDIEGVLSSDKYYVVQTRPQVGVDDE